MPDFIGSGCIIKDDLHPPLKSFPVLLSQLGVGILQQQGRSPLKGSSAVSSRNRYVVDLPVIGYDVRVRACGREEVVVADELADPGPWHPAQVESETRLVALRWQYAPGPFDSGS